MRLNVVATVWMVGNVTALTCLGFSNSPWLRAFAVVWLSVALSLLGALTISMPEPAVRGRPWQP